MNNVNDDQNGQQQALPGTNIYDDALGLTHQLEILVSP